MPPPKETFVVSGPFVVLDHEPGEEFEGPLPDWVDRKALLESGAVKVKGSETQKVACPVCKAAKKAANFPDLDALAAHYKKDHPALEPPEKEE